MKERYYIGGYSKGNHFTLAYGEGNEIIEAYEIENASYLTLSPNKRNLYAVIETNDFTLNSGGVAAFEILENGKLKFLNQMPTRGAHPCHLSASEDGRFLYVANYSGGSTIYFTLDEQGVICGVQKYVHHDKYGQPTNSNPKRQEAPHAHYIQANKIDGQGVLWVCDLGLDKVIVLNRAGDVLGEATMPDGFGARHMAFHPEKPKAYVVGELGKGIISMDYKLETTGGISLSVSAPLLIATEDVSCAAVRLSTDGKFLLASNRGGGADSISVVRLDDKGNFDGLVSVFPLAYKCPRDFDFTPDGKFVWVCFQDSDCVQVFAWDNGRLLETDRRLLVDRPTCILFY